MCIENLFNCWEILRAIELQRSFETGKRESLKIYGLDNQHPSLEQRKVQRLSYMGVGRQAFGRPKK